MWCRLFNPKPLIFCRTKRLLCLMTTVKTWLVSKLSIGSTKDFRYVPRLGSYSQSSRFAYTQRVTYVIKIIQSGIWLNIVLIQPLFYTASVINIIIIALIHVFSIIYSTTMNTTLSCTV